MTRNNLKKSLVLLMCMVMMVGTITAVAGGRKEDTCTISGNTKVLGSVFIEESGFWQHRGNWTVSVVGSDRDAVTIKYCFKAGDKTVRSGIIGPNNMFFRTYTKTGWFSEASTEVGTNTNSIKYMKLIIED